jgi:phage-related protein
MAIDKPLVWLKGEVKTPPFSHLARIETGVLLRRLQKGEPIGMPHSRPMPSVGKRCHELRIRDESKQWRLIYRIDTDAIVIAEVFAKTTRSTPKTVIQICKRRLSQYDADSADDGEDKGEKESEGRKAKKT